MSKLALSTIWVRAALLCLSLSPAILFAGETYYPVNDTIPKVGGIKDSIRNVFDSTRKASASLINLQIQRLRLSADDVLENAKAELSDMKKVLTDSMPKVRKFSIDLPSSPFKKTGDPFLQFNGALVNYNFFYRTNIDTPYVQKNVMQHTVTGNVHLTIAGSLPLRVTYLARNSNSVFFRDIYDVRVEFDAGAFRERLVSGYRKKVANVIDGYKDSLTQKLYLSKLPELNALRDWVNSPFTLQRVYEMNEVARMPEITYNRSLPDSIAKKISDSLQAQARLFLEEYARKKEQYHKLATRVDSLKYQYNASLREIDQLKQMLGGKHPGQASFSQLKEKIRETTGKHIKFPGEYEWLLGIRKFSVGRNPVNYSELTAKNISLNGINFEYNSWYYVALTAGLIDYRFRDFSVRFIKQPPQYMYMLRLGVGQLEKNYVIASFFQGRKQLYTSESASKGVPVTGLSIESKYRFARHSYLVAEFAQSISPDFNYNPPGENKFFDLSDRSNKAVAFRLYSYIPKTHTRVEGLYKYTGANYQSFTSFQTNAYFVSWHLKADQQFFRRQLKVTASLRSNEFSNPYIIQQYKTNSVFKSLQVSFRKKKWPIASLGYLPVSQFTRLDNQLLESRFHTLNASISHIYKLGTRQTATSFVFSRFYNASSDSAFTYFNALNFVLSQNFFFKGFNAAINITQTRNPDYLLNILDGNVQVPVSDNVGFGFGAKVNNLNKETVRMGYYGNVQIRLKKQDAFYISYEKGYLTGVNNNLVRNDFLVVNFSKHF